MLGEEAEVRICNEPSDILWENLEFSKIGRTSRACISTILVVIFLIFTFGLFSYLRSHAGEFADKYPSSTSCTRIKRSFTKNNLTNIELFKTVAL